MTQGPPDLRILRIDFNTIKDRQYILDEYTFLKRPVFIIDNEIFIGNAKKTIETLKNKLSA